MIRMKPIKKKKDFYNIINEQNLVPCDIFCITKSNYCHITGCQLFICHIIHTKLLNINHVMSSNRSILYRVRYVYISLSVLLYAHQYFCMHNFWFCTLVRETIPGKSSRMFLWQGICLFYVGSHMLHSSWDIETPLPSEDIHHIISWP